MASSPVPILPGGVPDHTDFILCCVFLALFGIVTLYLRTTVARQYGKVMPWASLCFGFCTMRLAALGLRLATTNQNASHGLIITAQVFLSAGTVMLYLVNMQLARRFFGQLHPQYGRTLQYIANSGCICVLVFLALSIVAIVISQTTTDPSTLSGARGVRLLAACSLTILSAVPIPVIITALIFPSDKFPETPPVSMTGSRYENLSMLSEPDLSYEPAITSKRMPGEPNTGYGPKPTSIAEANHSASFVLVPSILLTIEQGIRTAQAFFVYDPNTGIPWYMTKGAFWVFIFGFEWIVILMLAACRIPLRFSNLPRSSPA